MAEKITLNAPDISCSHCVASVQKAVSALPGVESVSASESTKNVDVVFDNNAVDVARIAQALSEAGYPATPV